MPTGAEIRPRAAALGRVLIDCVDSGARASLCTLVASMTASRPRARRFAAMKCSTSNASRVAVWSFSSSLTSARHASEPITSLGRKCLRANVLFPAPLGPISTTRQSLGIFRCIEQAVPATGRRRRKEE